MYVWALLKTFSCGYHVGMYSVYICPWYLKLGAYVCCNILDLWTPLICNVHELRKMAMCGNIVLEI